MNIELLMAQLLNGIVLGNIYILIAIGLTIVFGMLNIVNFAHGVLYALGAYFAFSFSNVVGDWLGSFWIALIIAPIGVGIFGALIEMVLLRKIYDADHAYQILLTFGLMLVIQELIVIIWGPIGKSISTANVLEGTLDFGLFIFPKYRIFLIVFSSFICLILWLLIEKTSYGSIIRAGIDNRDMVNCLGIDIHKVFTVVFAIGVGLAGMGGVLVLPMRGAQPFMGDTILIISFVVVVIAGMGSFTGAILGGLIVGIVESMMALIWPKGTMIAIFAAMTMVLLIKPRGLFGLR